LLQRFLETSRLAECGYLRKPYMLELLAQHRAGQVDHNYRLWFLLNLEIWWRLYADGTPADRVAASMDHATSAPAVSVVLSAAPGAPAITAAAHPEEL
jgi:hypothetical protein